MTRLGIAAAGVLAFGLYILHGTDLAHAVGSSLYVFMGVVFFMAWLYALITEH